MKEIIAGIMVFMVWLAILIYTTKEEPKDYKMKLKEMDS